MAMVVAASPSPADAIDSIAIPSSTLAFLLRSVAAAPGDSDGLLLGRLTPLPSPHLSDDSSLPAERSPPLFSASIASFLSLSSPSSLSSPLGLVDLSHYRNLSAPILGSFAFRRRRSSAAPRPSMRDVATAVSLSRSLSSANVVFLLLSYSDSLIHTHEYRAYAVSSSGVFTPVSVRVLNLGPSFREQYSAFQPESPMPELPVRAGSGGGRDNSIAAMKRQGELDRVVQGFKVDRLEKMVAAGANVGSDTEELYKAMLKKLDGLVKMVEKGSASLLDQESQNLRLRRKLAGLE